jgi:16S rRNA (uracil1498-N3)-methyltransferase
MKQGDEIITVSSDEVAYTSVLTSVDSEIVTFKPVKEIISRELDVQVTIGIGLLKGDKYDLVIQKCTELGAYAFQPLSMKRSVVKLDSKKFEKKKIRWERISKEASEQSHRSHIPDIKQLKTLRELNLDDFDSVFVAYEEESVRESEKKLGELLKSINKSDKILVLIGPEGGFEVNEIDDLIKKGVKSISLGKRILRAETAPLFFMSTIGFLREL